MRLWHKDLLPVLPREQLVAQWKECSQIAGMIQKKGKVNHVIINYINDCQLDHLISYALEVRAEMTKRGYRTMQSVEDKIISLQPDYKKISHEDIYASDHNDDYYKICYWNLYEKHIRGGIEDEDWKKIKNYKKVE